MFVEVGPRQFPTIKIHLGLVTHNLAADVRRLYIVNGPTLPKPSFSGRNERKGWKESDLPDHDILLQLFVDLVDDLR